MLVVMRREHRRVVSVHASPKFFFTSAIVPASGCGGLARISRDIRVMFEIRRQSGTAGSMSRADGFHFSSAVAAL
jgi:hypothetical protein